MCDKKGNSCFPLDSNKEDPPNIHAKGDGECECASWEKAFEGQLALFKEEEEGKVSVRSRYKGDEGQKTLDEFINEICKEIRTKEIRKIEVDE